MRIRVTPTAARTGFLRVWLRRIPLNSGRVHAHRLQRDGSRGPVVAHADVYGRGEGSDASQRCLLLFRRVDEEAPWPVGEALELASADVPLDFDVIEVE